MLGEIGRRDPRGPRAQQDRSLSGFERARLARRYPGSVPVSALTGEGIDGVLQTLELTLPDPPVDVELLVPYGLEDVIALLYRDSDVVETSHAEDGTLVKARVGFRELAAVREFVRRAPLGCRRAAALRQVPGQASGRLPGSRSSRGSLGPGARDHAVGVVDLLTRQVEGEHLQADRERDLSEQWRRRRRLESDVCHAVCRGGPATTPAARRAASSVTR